MHKKTSFSDVDVLILDESEKKNAVLVSVEENGADLSWD